MEHRGTWNIPIINVLCGGFLSYFFRSLQKTDSDLDWNSQTSVRTKTTCAAAWPRYNRLHLSLTFMACTRGWRAFLQEKGGKMHEIASVLVLPQLGSSVGLPSTMEGFKVKLLSVIHPCSSEPGPLFSPLLFFFPYQWPCPQRLSTPWLQRVIYDGA